MRVESKALGAFLAISLALPLLTRAGASPDERIEIGSIDLEALLDAPVVAATRREARASDAPAWVFVLTAEDLRRQGYRTLHEALRSVPGLFTYADGLFPSVGVRGVGLLTDYSTRVLILVDGHPLNNSVGIGQSYLGRDLLVPLAAVKRIEIIEGPVGSVYGPTAFLGVINVVTWAPGEARLELAASGEAAQGAMLGGEGSALGGGERGGVAISAAASFYGTRGPRLSFTELDLTPGRTTPGGDVGRTGFADAEAGYARIAWRGVELSGGCGRSRAGIPTAPYESIAGDSRNALTTLTCFGQGSWVAAPRSDLELAARIAADVFDYRDLFAYDPPPVGYGEYGDGAWDRWGSAELRVDWRPSAATRLAAGATGEAHWTSQWTFVDMPGVAIPPIRKDFLTVNAWLIGERGVGDRLRLHGALTAYAHEIFGARVTPRIAAVLRATPADVVKVIYEQGFRAPTAAEAFYEDGTDFLPNPELRPERVHAVQAIYERRFGNVASLSVTGFWSQYRDLIRFETVPAPPPAAPGEVRQKALNVASLRVAGGELGFTVRLGDGLSAWGGVSVQRTDTERSVNFPTVTAGAALSTRWPWRPLTLSLSLGALSARHKDATAFIPGQRPTVPAAAALSAAAALDVPGVQGLAIELSVIDLLGPDMVHPVAGDFTPISEQPEPVRTFRAGVRWQP